MNAWEMIKRCKERQWAGYPAAQQAWMSEQSLSGRPAFLSVGYKLYTIWRVEHWTTPFRRNVPRPADILMSVKVDQLPTRSFLEGPTVQWNREA